MAPRKEQQLAYPRRAPGNARGGKNKRAHPRPAAAPNSKKKKTGSDSQASTTRTVSEQVDNSQALANTPSTPQPVRVPRESPVGTPLNPGTPQALHSMHVSPNIPPRKPESAPHTPQRARPSSSGEVDASESVRNESEEPVAEYPDAQPLLPDTDELRASGNSGEDHEVEPAHGMELKDIVHETIMAVREEIGSVFTNEIVAKVDKLNAKLSELENKLDSQVEKMKDKESTFTIMKSQLDTLTSSVVSVLRSKHVKSQYDLTFHSLKKICAGQVFGKKFAAVFITSVSPRNDMDNMDISKISHVLMGIFYCRQPTERRKNAAEEPLLTPHAKFRRDFIFVFFSTISKDKFVGYEQCMSGTDILRLPKPDWLHDKFLPLNVIDNMLVAEFPGTFKAKGKSEGMEKEKELARRINSVLTQHLNKGREHSRTVLFESFGFIWEKEAHCNITCAAGEDLSVQMEDIPQASEDTRMSSENLREWDEILKKTEKCMTGNISYSVRVYANNNKQGNYETRTMNTTINYLKIAVMFCLRFTGNLKKIELFSFGRQSFRALFAIGCLLRKLAITQFQLYQESDVPADDISEMENVLSSLLPPQDSREKLVRRVCSMSDDEFNRKNMSTSSVAAYTGHDVETVGENDLDEEMRALIG